MNTDETDSHLSRRFKIAMHVYFSGTSLTIPVNMNAQKLNTNAERSIREHPCRSAAKKLPTTSVLQVPQIFNGIRTAFHFPKASVDVSMVNLDIVDCLHLVI